MRRVRHGLSPRTIASIPPTIKMSTIQNIFFRDAHGNKVAYSPDSLHHTLISPARDFVRNLLLNERGVQALCDITNQCEKARSQQYGIHSEGLVNTFIGAMKSETAFPTIIVDAVVTKELGVLSKVNAVQGDEVRFQDFEISINHPVCTSVLERPVLIQYVLTEGV